MILKGLKDIEAHMDSQYERNLDAWYKNRGMQRPQRGNTSPYSDEWDDDSFLEFMHIGIPNLH